jgi:hypothetical protein
MSSFDDVFEDVMGREPNTLAIATLTSNQVNGVVGVAKAVVGPIFSEDRDDAYGRYLGTDDPDGVQLFSDRWVADTPPAGIDEGFVQGQPYPRNKQDNLGFAVHKSLSTGAYRCVLTLASWGGGTFTLQGAFEADVLVAVAASVGPDTGAGPAEPAVYTLSLKVVQGPALNPPPGGVAH